MTDGGEPGPRQLGRGSEVRLEHVQVVQIGDNNRQYNYFPAPRETGKGLAATLVVLVLGAGLALAAVAFAVRGWQGASGLVSLMPVAIVALIAILLLRTPLFRRAREGELDLQSASRNLAGLTARQWRPETPRRDLNSPLSIMPVLWRLRDADLVPMAGERTPVRFEGTSREIAGLVAQFKALPAKRLLILGGPGSGKTTLAIQLLLELLRQRDPEDPVPVLLSLSEWDPASTPEFREWLVGQVGRNYPALGTAGTALAGAGLILPILDGLDELPAGARQAVIAALNRGMTDNDQMIVTSRVREYDAAEASGRTSLHADAVIVPEPLTPAAAAGYLRAREPRGAVPEWEDVLAALDGPAPPAALAEVVATPLGLWLVHETYRHLGPQGPRILLREDRFATGAELRGYLLDQLIPAVLDKRGPPRHRGPDAAMLPRRRYRDPGQVRRWLESLTDYLADPRAAEAEPVIRFPPPPATGPLPGRDFRWWRLGAVVLPARAISRAYVVAGAFTGAAVGAGLYFTFPDSGYGRVLASSPGSDNGAGELVVLAVVGLLIGGLAGRRAGAHAGKSLADGPVFARLHSPRQWGRLASYAAVVAGLGVAPDVLPMPARWYTAIGTSPPALFPTAVAHSAGWGLILAAVVWGRFLPKAADVSPYAAWRSSRDIVLARMALIVIGIDVALPDYSQVEDNPAAVVGQLVTWTIIGSAAAMLTGRRTWLVFLLATHHEARRGRLPARLMAFLDDVHRLGLLRTVGPVYQFRHAELQDHLTSSRRGPAHQQVQPRRPRQAARSPSDLPVGWATLKSLWWSRLRLVIAAVAALWVFLSAGLLLRGPLSRAGSLAGAAAIPLAVLAYVVFAVAWWWFELHRDIVLTVAGKRLELRHDPAPAASGEDGHEQDHAGSWTRLAVQVGELQALAGTGRSRQVLAESVGLRTALDFLPATPGPDEAVTAWEVRELLFHTGRVAAWQARRWADVLAFNAGIVASQRARGASPADIAATRLDDLWPLRSLGRADEELALLHDCLTAFYHASEVSSTLAVLDLLAETAIRRGDGGAALSYLRDSLRYAYLTEDVPSIALVYHNHGYYLRTLARQPAEALASHLAAALITTLAGIEENGNLTAEFSVASAAAALRAFGRAAVPPTDVASLCRRLDVIPGTDLAGLLDAHTPGPGTAEQIFADLVTQAQDQAVAWRETFGFWKGILLPMQPRVRHLTDFVRQSGGQDQRGQA